MDPHIVAPEDAPQPFNFEMAGMKITQAANLETRVLQLENRVQRMEKAVIKLHRYQSAEALQLQDPPKSRNHNKFNSASYGHRPATSTSEASFQRHGEGRHRTLETGVYGSQYRSSSYGSSRPRTVETEQTQQLPSLEHFPISSQPNNHNTTTTRPLSTSTTIRGIPSSSPTISKDGSFTAEHLTYLTNLILNEQTARQQLETIVQNLSHQITTLKSQNQISQHSLYPTPNSERGSNHYIPSNQAFGGRAGSGGHEGFAATNGIGGFDGFENDSSDEEEEAGRYDSEVFQTPMEERGGFADGDSTFGDVMGTTGTGGGKGVSSRTMSLSRMTGGGGLGMV
jgi:hypothetical protein